MDRFDSMRIFAKVVESGSFASAAARLGISPGTASEHVKELEERLGTQLMHRTTRKLALTDTGRAFCAAPTYLERRGTPKTPADLAAHDCLTLTGPSELRNWHLIDVDGTPVDVVVTGHLRSNSVGVLMCAALAG